MGSDAAAMVDPRLRVRGVEGLRVVAPAILIGEQGARFLVEDLV